MCRMKSYFLCTHGTTLEWHEMNGWASGILGRGMGEGKGEGEGGGRAQTFEYMASQTLWQPATGEFVCNE